MDILDSAQQQINSAANQINPEAAAPPPPEPPPTPVEQPVMLSIQPPIVNPPPQLKEKALLSQPSSPPVPSVPPPSEPPQVEEPPPQTTTFGAQAPKEETPKSPQPSPPAPQPPPKKQGVNRGFVVAIVFILLATLPVAVYYVQQQRQLAEIRSRAGLCCEGGTCNDGWPFGPDQNAPQSSCAQRNTDACANRGGIKNGGGPCAGTTTGGTTTTTTGTRTVSTGGVPNGQSSGCCSSTSQCQSWFGSASTCTNLNGACSSGVQCKGGGCGETCGNKPCGTVICQGTNYQQTCNALCLHRCGDLVCNADETAQSCPSDCKIISAGTTTTAGGTTCQKDKIICRKDNPSICPTTHNYNNPSIDATVGISCNGTLADPSRCNFFDACGVPVVEGDSCEGKVRTSTGEPSHGGFVGCSGIKNCFCGDASKSVRGTYTAADGVVRCYDDAPNQQGLPDSCGAAVRPAAVVTAPAASSGCKSDWCTSEIECTSKGGQMGTPQSFAYCSPGLVACCLPSGGGTTIAAQPTATPQPPAGQCTRIKVYKENVAVNPKTLVPGDSVKLAVAGTNATRGRIRVNGAAFTETTTKNASGEFTVPFTVPSGITNFTIEAEVFTGGKWK